VRIALYQFAPEPLRLEENLRRILDAADRAQRAEASLLVTPEMALTGWSLPDATTRERLIEEVERFAIPQLATKARSARLGIVVGGPYRGDGAGASNCAIGFSPDGTVVVHRKVHLFGAERGWWIAGGQADAVIRLGDLRVGLLICYDAEFPEMPRLLRLAGVDVMAIPATNMSPYERDQELIFPTRALENECVVAVCNRTGRERGWSYFGRSLIADARGIILAQAGSDEELLIADVEPREIVPDPDLSYLARRRPEVYASLTRPGEEP
jgi:predicted amidohydrolase